MNLSERVLDKLCSSEEEGKQRILVVDDEIFNRRFFRQAAEKRNFAVVEARDGEEASQQLAKGGFAGVILDVRMPRKNGLQVLEEMRAGDDETSVVIVSGSLTSEVIQQIEKAGGHTSVLKKPFTLETLDEATLFFEAEPPK